MARSVDLAEYSNLLDALSGRGHMSQVSTSETECVRYLLIVALRAWVALAALSELSAHSPVRVLYRQSEEVP